MCCELKLTLAVWQTQSLYCNLKEKASKNIKENNFHPFPVFPLSSSGPIHKSNHEPARMVFFSILLSRDAKSVVKAMERARLPPQDKPKKTVEQILSSPRFMKCSLLLAVAFDTEGLRHWLFMTFQYFSHINPAPPCSSLLLANALFLSPSRSCAVSRRGSLQEPGSWGEIME